MKFKILLLIIVLTLSGCVSKTGLVTLKSVSYENLEFTKDIQEVLDKHPDVKVQVKVVSELEMQKKIDFLKDSCYELEEKDYYLVGLQDNVEKAELWISKELLEVGCVKRFGIKSQNVEGLIKELTRYLN